MFKRKLFLPILAAFLRAYFINQKLEMKYNFIIITILFSILCSSKVNAQSYEKALGIRAGSFESGITGKYFLDDVTAVEGILGFRTGLFVLTGLYEKHAPAFEVPDLKWYFGLGAHIGSIDNRRYRGIGNDDQLYNGILIGADAVIGLEWIIPEAPISLGADLHPRIELGKGPFINLEPAISIRYIF